MSKKSNRVVLNTPSTHRLTVGQLKGPLGTFSLEQLESAKTLVEREHEKAERALDETTAKRLEKDLAEVEAELERRELLAA